MIMNYYYEQEWYPWKFVQTPIGFWDDAENVRKY